MLASNKRQKGQTDLTQIYILYRCGQVNIYILYRCGQDEPEERKDEEEDEKERRKKEQERSKAEIAEQLLQLGAKAGAKELKGEQTPLHLAAMNGMEQVQCIPINKRIQ